MNVKDSVICEYKKILDAQYASENDIQRFLESNSELIPTPYLDNHCLHFNVVLSKFHLGNGYVTDFAYLTKSSDSWHFVLIELENPNKKIFTKNNENIYFHSDFNHSYDQIMSWKAYVQDNKESILKSISKLRVPLSENTTDFKYVLVIGRSAEKETSEKRKKMFAQKCNDDVIVMTYDSIISRIENDRHATFKLILSPWKDIGFNIKSIPKHISTSIFAYVLPEFLKIENDDIEKLKSQGYQMDDWLNGKSLWVNNKYSDINFSSERSSIRKSFDVVD